ncbi:MAG: hypothetical protein WA755_08820 [Candidatus Acidiferrales bacterium]
MRYLRIVSLIVAFQLVFQLIIQPIAASAQAQKGDWRAVEELPYGAYITVKTQYRFACMFQSATDAELICGHGRGRFGAPGAGEMKIDRASVREVRYEHMDHGNPAIGVAVGGALGAAVGSAVGVGVKAHIAGALIFGTIGAGLGAMMAANMPIFHRKVIYRR